LPLALELAGAYLRHRPISLSQYRDALQRNIRDALQGRFLASFTNHEADLYSTLKIDEEVFSEEPQLRNILDILTWSGPGPMSLSLLQHAVGAVSEADLVQPLALGVALRLLKFHLDTNGYSLHRLVREVRRGEGSLVDIALSPGEISTRIASWFTERRRAREAFRGDGIHLTEWQEHAERLQLSSSPLLTWLRAYPFYYQGQYTSSEQWAERALKSVNGSTDARFEGSIMNDLAILANLRGNYQRSLQLANLALKLNAENYGSNTEETASSLDAIANAYDALRKRREALHYAKEAVAAWVALGVNIGGAAAKRNLAVVYFGLGDFDSALRLASEAESEFRLIAGPVDEGISRTVSAIAAILAGQGRKDLAMNKHHEPR